MGLNYNYNEINLNVLLRFGAPVTKIIVQIEEIDGLWFLSCSFNIFELLNIIKN